MTIGKSNSRKWGEFRAEILLNLVTQWSSWSNINNPNWAIGLLVIVIIIGAGDEIRTHDPNLGKVVLYP